MTNQIIEGPARERKVEKQICQSLSVTFSIQQHSVTSNRHTVSVISRVSSINLSKSPIWGIKICLFPIIPLKTFEVMSVVLIIEKIFILYLCNAAIDIVREISTAYGMLYFLFAAACCRILSPKPRTQDMVRKKTTGEAMRRLKNFNFPAVWWISHKLATLVISVVLSFADSL